MGFYVNSKMKMKQNNQIYGSHLRIIRRLHNKKLPNENIATEITERLLNLVFFY
jgi:hypothetical protein